MVKLVKKVKDNRESEDNILDISGDIKPILFIACIPPTD